MRVLVNGVRLYFDVEGASLVPDGAAMRAKPTLILLHGGPGFDHTIYKPAFAALADIAQVVYLDHRGNGRSEPDAHENWNLAQWGDDVRSFCDALEIAQPIVYGASFGGMVALAYATRHPDHPAKLIVVSTEAKGYSHLERRVALFERLGGPEVGALARRRFLEGHHDAAILEAWLRLALPVYVRTPRDPDRAARAIRRDELRDWFSRPGGELWTFDLFPALSRIACPILVMGGEDDPMVPIECQADIAATLPRTSCPVRALCGLRPRHRRRCADARDGRDPRLHPPWLRSTPGNSAGACGKARLRWQRPVSSSRSSLTWPVRAF